MARLGTKPNRPEILHLMVFFDAPLLQSTKQLRICYTEVENKTKQNGTKPDFYNTSRRMRQTLKK